MYIIYTKSKFFWFLDFILVIKDWPVLNTEHYKNVCNWITESSQQ